jgi:HEAT repeat protein
VSFLLMALFACGLSSSDVARNLSSSNPVVREDTAKIARNFGSDGVEKALMKAIEDPSEKVRYNAVNSLAELEAEQAVSVLMDRLDVEPSLKVQRVIVDALGRLGDVKAVPVLIAYLEVREDTMPPLNAIWALGKLEDHRSLAVLSRLWKSKDPFVRWNANQALRNLRPPPASSS